MILRNELENFWREEHRKAGYQEIKTPIILERSYGKDQDTGIIIKRICILR
jgi:threonyl-tRNA synthetase